MKATSTCAKAILFLLVLGLGNIAPLYALQPAVVVPANKLKKTLLSIYQGYRLTFFCQDEFDERGFIATKRCPKCPKTPTKIQWMPIVSHQQLTKHLPCFQEKRCTDKQGLRFKGVHCCAEYDPFFKIAKFDLHNYVPELGVIIQQRRQYAFAELSSEGEATEFCGLHRYPKNKIIVPPTTTRGMIARAYLYMRDTYHLPLNNQELALFQTWHKQYPPNEWEISRNEKIALVQGNRNPYIL